MLFFGYTGSSQITCPQLMSKKIAAAQSTLRGVSNLGLDRLTTMGIWCEVVMTSHLVSGSNSAPLQRGIQEY